MNNYAKLPGNDMWLAYCLTVIGRVSVHEAVTSWDGMCAEFERLRVMYTT